MARRSSSARQSAREKYLVTSEGWHARGGGDEIVASAEIVPIVFEGAEDVPEAIEVSSIVADVEYAPEVSADIADLAESLSEIETLIESAEAEVSTKIADAETELAEVEAEIEQAEVEADAEVTEVQLAEERLDYLYNRLHEIEGDLEEYPEDLMELEQEFENIRAEIQNVQSYHLDVTEANVEELLETMTAREILDAWGFSPETPTGDAIYRGETPFLEDVLQFFVDVGGASEYFFYTETEGGYAIWEVQQPI